MPLYGTSFVMSNIEKEWCANTGAATATIVTSKPVGNVILTFIVLLLNSTPTLQEIRGQTGQFPISLFKVFTPENRELTRLTPTFPVRRSVSPQTGCRAAYKTRWLS